MELLVLDVGHGNSAIILEDCGVVVVDTGYGPHLSNALRSESVTVVHQVLISHSDADHAAGVIGVLLDKEVEIAAVRLNPDAMRGSKFWDDIKLAIGDARRRCGTRLVTDLTADSVLDVPRGSRSRLEVLHPPAELAMGGVGAKAEQGVLTPNSMSAVVRVSMDGKPIALLAGDLDLHGLRRLVASEVDMSARVLVFPHHGGWPEGARDETEVVEFTRQILLACSPDQVLFSTGRGRHGTPRPEIVRTIRIEFPEVGIACTQLSKRCADEPHSGDTHLNVRYAAGRSRGVCCLGTGVLGPDGVTSPAFGAHAAAVELLPQRVCR